MHLSHSPFGNKTGRGCLSPAAGDLTRPLGFQPSLPMGSRRGTRLPLLTGGRGEEGGCPLLRGSGPARLWAAAPGATWTRSSWAVSGQGHEQPLPGPRVMPGWRPSTHRRLLTRGPERTMSVLASAPKPTGTSLRRAGQRLPRPGGTMSRGLSIPSPGSSHAAGQSTRTASLAQPAGAPHSLANE